MDEDVPTQEMAGSYPAAAAMALRLSKLSEA